MCRLLAQNKLEKFHPMELYLYFHFGLTSGGVCDIPYFLETDEIIQKTVKSGDVVNREQLCKRNTDELEQQVKVKKDKPLLINNVDEMEECDPT